MKIKINILLLFNMVILHYFKKIITHILFQFSFFEDHQSDLIHIIFSNILFVCFYQQSNVTEKWKILLHLEFLLNICLYLKIYLLTYNSIRESLSTAMHTHKLWSTLKTFLFGVNSFLTPIRTDDGSFTYDPSKMAEVISTVFQNKQSDLELNLPPTCFPKPKSLILLLNHLR